MSFNEINADTGKPWTRAELFHALEKVRAKAPTVSSRPEVGQSDIISWPHQSANLRARWAIHTEEFNIAIKDLKALYKSVLVLIENQREYWSTNPLLKQ